MDWTTGVSFSAYARPYSLPPHPDQLWDLSSLLVSALSLGVKWPGHEAGHSHLSSAKFKNAWSYTSTPTIHLHGVVLSRTTGTTSPLPCNKLSSEREHKLRVILLHEIPLANLSTRILAAVMLRPVRRVSVILTHNSSWSNPLC